MQDRAMLYFHLTLCIVVVVVVVVKIQSRFKKYVLEVSGLCFVKTKFAFW